MRFFERMIAAREKEARRQVARYLSNYDAATLAEFGYRPNGTRGNDQR